MPPPWIPAALLAALPLTLAATAQEASDAAAPPDRQLRAVQMLEEDAADEAALPAPEEEEGGAVRTPAPLGPVDAWREDPTVVLSGVDASLEDFRWIARPVVVFADSEFDPAFQQQMIYLAARMDALAERDVVVLTDTDPAADSALRRELRPRGFMLVLMGKEGQVVQRKPSPWDVREITRAIDKMPQRQQEIRERLNPNL